MNAPDPLALIERPAIDGAQYLPLNLVRPWVYNPRKRFTPAELDEMADSIEKFGVIQPVIVGKDAPAIALLEDPHTHELVKVVRADDAMQVLRDKGVIKGNKLSSRSDAERKAEQKQKAEVAWRNELAQSAVAASIDPQYDDADMHTWLLPELASAMWTRLDHETTKRACKLLGLTVSVDPDTYFRGLDARHLDQAFVAMAVAGQLYVNPHSSSKPTRLLAIAGRLGIDGARVRAELETAAKAKVKAPAVKRAPAKKVAAKATAAKYRNAQTGETWSGRGLKPKWLAVALMAGKTLADFDTEGRDPESQGATANSGKGVEKSKKTESTASPSTSEDNKPAAAKAAGKTKAKQTDKTPARAGVPIVITPAGAWPFPTSRTPTVEKAEVVGDAPASEAN